MGQCVSLQQAGNGRRVTANSYSFKCADQAKSIDVHYAGHRIEDADTATNQAMERG